MTQQLVIDTSGLRAGAGLDNSEQMGRCKVYIVQVDDLDREKVFSCEVENVKINRDVDYGDIRVDSLLDSVKIFKNSEVVTISEMRLVRREDGTLYSIEDFTQMEEEEEE